MTRAPAGLRLAQDLINTATHTRAGDPRQDHLADLATARTWLRHALEDWSEATGAPAPDIDLTEADLPELRDLRETLREPLRASSDNATATTGPADFRERASDIRLAVTTDGRITYQPLGGGSEAIAAMIAAETLLAQTAGTWKRLKTCAHPACGVCFYDSSPNRSRAWHDTKTCGNINNLRASRARRRTETDTPADVNG
jgi:predicted RNA-binding Zn ribbon-like protein